MREPVLSLEVEHGRLAILLEPGLVAELDRQRHPGQVALAGQDVFQARFPVHEPRGKLEQHHARLPVMAEWPNRLCNLPLSARAIKRTFDIAHDAYCARTSRLIPRVY
jgi:hypothetical protein